MKNTVKSGLILVIVLINLFSCTDSESLNTEDAEKKDSLCKIAQFGDMIIVGDTNIFDGRLWRLEVILGDDRIRLDTINRVLKIIELDIDDNQNPEIYIQTQAVGSGSFGKLYGFTANEDGKLTAILFPEYHEGQFDSLFYNYSGHDIYEFYPSKIVRRFPRYKDNDPNCCPSLGEMIITDSLFLENKEYLMKPIDFNILED